MAVMAVMVHPFQPQVTDMSQTDRQPDGRFAPGNRAAAGRNAKRVESWRRTFRGAVSNADLRAIIRQLVQQAREGDTTAARILLDRCLGPAEAHDLLARVEEVEQRLEGNQ